jgi:DNA-binding transcriptional regulator YiaG
MKPNLSADRLRRLLAEGDLSQCAAARALGINERTMRNWCDGKHRIRRMVFLALQYVIANQEEDRS